MLSLRNVKKDYVTGDTVVNALKGVSLDFRDNEFVSILGPSGCGKTTLLNIVGGLDRYTDGDLIINGVSTKLYSDGDWDAYRNHTIGFVFQTYNLIMHQTVLANVELALTLSGVSPKERKERAAAALERVGLGDQINKMPNQLSGGQMQRVAIARAIVNDPDIILADEPTGALDTQTSVQVMDILKEISKDKLIIMVTHNPELAEQYSTRIVRLSDGELISDTMPVTAGELESKGCIEQAVEAEKEEKPHKSRKNAKKKPSMSLFTALSLSLKNLLTKKARTVLVSFAGSIGIIGIALILSLSDGFQMYINKVQEDTLSGYPLTIEAETVDMSAMVSAMMGITSDDKNENKDPNTVYANNMMSKMLTSMMQQQVENNLKDFKKTLIENEDLKEKITAIKYTYDFTPQIYFDKDHPLNATKKCYQVSPSMVGEMVSMSSSMSNFGFAPWTEMLDNRELLESQYDLIGNSKWPESYNEVVIVVDKNEEINDYILYSLGLINPEEMYEMMQNLMAGKPIVEKEHKYTYDEILDISYKLMLQADYYKMSGNGYIPRTDDEILQIIDGTYTYAPGEEMATVIDIDVVGIIKPKEGVSATSVAGTVGYLSSLTERIIDLTNEKPIVTRQFNVPDRDVFSGLPFEADANAQYTLSMVDKYFMSALPDVTDTQASL
ncbi:MAG: ABC transporter ATP-binding protein, partial [Clostridia bacterium]|nr:ABC transporter ATP-binding protein [Clostridia bacterium]